MKWFNLILPDTFSVIGENNYPGVLWIIGFCNHIKRCYSLSLMSMQYAPIVNVLTIKCKEGNPIIRKGKRKKNDIYPQDFAPSKYRLSAYIIQMTEIYIKLFKAVWE